ncbi:MAG TPA: bifunctional metallophosphatase/5'-nucleotidase [Marmoricola sp.]|nr:bifunctional metallophosphatase/5'-nucleotidase [Marmoricola sp.]
MSNTTSRRARWAAASVTALALGVAPFTAVGGASAASGDAPSDDGIAATTQKVVHAKKGVLRLHLLAINDFHGQLEPVPTTSSSGKIFTGPAETDFTPAGGAAYLARHLDRLRHRAAASGAKTVTVAAGDLIGASPLLSAAFHDEPSIEAMNRVGLDIASVGNHEFDEGWRELKRMQRGGCIDDGAGENNQNSCPDHRFKGADFQYLSANVKKEKSGRTVFPSYKIERFGKVKVGFIGMTLQDTPNIVTQSGVEGLRFTDEVRTVRQLMPKLRKKGVKSVVVLLHQGGVPTPSYAYNGCPSITGPGVDIAQRLPAGVDAVISGHTHQAYNCTVTDPRGRPRLFTSASSIGRMVTDMTLQIDKKSKDVIRPLATAKNVIVSNSDGTRPKQNILNLIRRYKTLVAPIENTVLGQIAPADEQNSLSRTPDPDGGDSPLGNLIADSQLEFDGAIPAGGEEPTIAFMNPGGIRADLVENADGDVTYGAAFTVQPFNNYVTSQTLTGAQIRDLLNEQWNGRNEGAENNKILQVSGINYTWDRTLADAPDADAIVGDILVDVDGDGVDDVLDPAQSYRIVVNAFLADGGDGFATFAEGVDRYVGGLDIDALAEYLEVHDPYVPSPLDRISSTS